MLQISTSNISEFNTKMEKRPVLCINDVDSNRCAMLYTPLEYSTVLEQA